MLADLWRVPLPLTRSLYADAVLFAARIMAVSALFPNGARKIATFEQTAAAMGGTPQMIGGRLFPEQQPLFHFSAPELFLGASVVFDLIGSLLIVLGLKARAVAFLMAGYVTLAMAIYHSEIRHGQDVVLLLRNSALLASLLFVSVSGPGWWSLDGLLARRRP